MLEMKEFQKRLELVMALAAKNDKKLKPQEVAACFEEGTLSPEQMKSVYEYLQIQGIRLEGEEVKAAAVRKEETRENTPLSPEEQGYLEGYQKELEQLAPAAEGEAEALFERLANGDALAKARLTEIYLPEVVEAAKACHHGEIFIGDMIQEGNVCLMMALEGEIPNCETGEWLSEQLRSAMEQMAEEQNRVQFQDNCLVERVQNLENAIKKLTDDDTDAKFSVEELSAYLDMDVEEIRQVLRLTGEE